MSGIPVKPTSRKVIWTYVRDIRRILGVEDNLYFDVVWFVENIMPKIFSDFVFEICTQEELGDSHGKTVPRENKICIREDVYIGACEGNGRDRLTIAHEIGHFFMHDEHSIEFCQSDSNGKTPCYRDSDWQADVFGGELLAPSYLIGGMSTDEIHKTCIVSLPCANSQLRATERERVKQFKK